ncbi:BspA family leucine-rich repeat surface protein [Maribacter sp. LLG6340-A2]|uniref:BspA family leucine-rich repeat surface protein n=1 Tax=Maribacter sp. LLG6340-A2 TaxID=3160834 RepID=UPI0038652E96
MINQTKVFCSMIFAVFLVANSYGQQCNPNLPNEDASIVLPSGTVALGVDNVAGTATDTNASSCALVVENTDTGQPWGSYRIAIDLANYGIIAGDELFIAVDGKSLTGQARLEITPNNTPNNSLGARSFGSSWEHYETTFSVPSNLTTINLWFFSNYAQQNAGNAVYDNLVVRKANDEVLDFSNAFVITWKTDNPGVSANNQITIPTSDIGGYNYSVDWGDGTIESGFTGDATHTYSNIGTYTVSIIGEFPNIYFNGAGDKDKILTVEKWGKIVWQDFSNVFKGCTNLDVIATDIPNTANVFTYTAMFQDCKSLIGNYSFNNWDVGNSLGMAYMFAGAELFNQEISNWHLGTTMHMDSMFEGASSFNQPLSFEGMARTPTMVNMLKGATSFDQDLSQMPRYGSDMTGMLVNSGMSNENYDKTLIGWASNPRESGVVLDAPQNQYCISEEARQTLIDDFGWTINDAGKGCVTTCPNDLPNEDASIILPSGTRALGVDNVAGTAIGTYGSSCALVVENADTGQPWGSYRIAIDLASYGIVAGDELFIAVEGKSLTGQARLEITPNNTPNNSLGAHSFGSSWEHYETTFSVPSNLSTIDLWFFSNYAQQNAGNAMYDNLVVRKVNDEVLDFSNAFVTTWKTDNPGVSANNQITIPTITGGEFNGLGWSPDSFNYAVDWGDGSTESGFTGDATHTYAVPGTYTVSIIGDFPHIYFNGSGDKDKILSIEQWGDIRWISMVSAFEGCSNLDVVALDVPSPAQDYRAMFKDCKSLVGNSKFNDWDMGFAFGVAYMFAGAELFNQDISNWSFGTLFNMDGMFEGATSFNQPVSWGYSERTPTMINMFKDATSFDQDLSLMPRYGSDMTGMLVNSGMSNENYDKTLIGWGSSPKESNVVFDAPQNQYCLSEEARHTLIQEYGWIINDGGSACPNSACPTTKVELNTQQQVDDFASTFDIANCHFEGGIYISGTVTNLDGLYGLTELWGDLRILSSSVVNVDGLSSLTKVEGDLVIYNNDQLENLDGLNSLTEVLGEFYLRHNYQLNNIGGLSSLFNVGVLLDISHNDSLENLDGLDNLIYVWSDLTISNNEALTDIQGLASVRRIGDLYITSNEVLSNCAIDAICNPGIVRGYTIIGGNAGNCSNMEIAEASCSSSACPNDLPNEDASIVLPSGTVALGVDNVAGTAVDTNGSGCALEVSNVDSGQPWGTYRIAIQLSDYGINEGDQLFISVDGKSVTGTARVEINPNNTPNNSLGSRTFTNVWSTYETTFAVPVGLTTIDLWFFSNYAQQNAGKALYDNLEVINLSSGSSGKSFTETKSENNLEIYPNPATIETTFNFTKPTTVGTIQIFDVTGRLVRTIKGGEIDTDGTPVNVQEMPVGTYFVKTRDISGGEFQQQMLIQRQ